MTAWLLASALLLHPPSQQPAGQTRPAGAAISGIVLSVDPTPVPIRHARVDLSGAAEQSVVTGDSGTFEFTGLAAGRYEIAAEKLGLGRRVFAANRNATSATVVTLSPGQQLGGLRVVLPRGGVIGGAITDAGGAPIEGAVVSAIDPLHAAQPAATAESDGEGRYRIFGLSAGTYIVRVSPVQNGRRGTTGPVAVDTFYPNADLPRDAVSVTVGIGEERLGIDVAAQQGRQVEVSGTVHDAAGQAVGADVRLTRIGANAGEGSRVTAVGGVFIFSPVSSGSYVLRATLKGEAAESDDSAGLIRFTAVGRVDVTTSDQTGIALVVRPPATLSGRATIADGVEAAQLTPGKLVLTHADADTPEVIRADVQPDGAFAFDGLTPGSYMLNFLSTPGSNGHPWLVESATIDGHDALQQTIEIGPLAKSGLNVRLTPNVGTLRGRISRNDGSGAPELAIVVINADRQKWSTPSGKPMVIWPDTNGDWAIDTLAAGAYLVAALGEIVAADLKRADFLEAVAAGSVTVGVKAGVVAVQDLKIR